jgi:hypothetical protein
MPMDLPFRRRTSSRAWYILRGEQKRPYAAKRLVCDA